MTPPLFLIDELPVGDDFHLGGDEGRHAARVKRLAVDEAVLIADGRGTLLDCRVTEVVSEGLRLRVLRRDVVPEPDPRIVVVQALPKGDRAELAVEMLTELGVDEIVPWAAARSIVQWQSSRGDKALEKWRRTAREASKQSRRARVPVIGELAGTADVADRLRAACALTLHESAHNDAQHTLATAALPVSGDVIVVVGPEGGISPDELDTFAAAGAAAVRLGEGVLRTSTAGAAALAALSLRLGRWGRWGPDS